MSRLDELIAELCPNGVEFFRLKDCTEMKRGTSATKKTLVEGDIPVISGGKEPAFYCDSFNRDGETITIAGSGAGAGYVQYWNKPIFVNDAFSIKGSKKLNTRYVYHYLLSIQGEIYATKKGSGIPHVHISSIENFKIPIPPLPVQSEIVGILDNFTELSAALTAELQKRREQYRHYSTVLFDNAKKSGVHSIEEVCHIEKGKTPIQKATPGGYPMVVTTTERKSCDTYQFDAKAVCVPLVSSRGHGVASLNHVYYQEGKFALGNILCAIIPKNEELVNPKYLYYYFEQTKDYTLVPLMKGGANVALHMNDVKKVNVPIPSLEEQKRIVDILEYFETLCNDVYEGLPAEIEARQKQYEYYCDKLLTFQEIS